MKRVIKTKNLSKHKTMTTYLIYHKLIKEEISMQ